jgi:ribosomal protein RSM22 (predicted rRNA methylase)
MGFRFVDDFRNMILLMKNVKIIAPCPHHNECPIAKEGV